MHTTLTIPHLTLVVCADTAHPTASTSVEAVAPIPVTVDYLYHPGTPDVLTLPNGDPGYPGDPEELEVYTATATAPATLVGDGLTVTIAPGVDVLGLLSDEAVEDLALDLKRQCDMGDV